MNTKTLTVCKASAGSGKTFTLAAHYVALLMAGESYRSILAVTFTNKATAEMKTRILTYLYAIAQGAPDADTMGFLEKVRGVMEHAGYSEPKQGFAAKAQQLFTEILADYDNMRVCTIDSFLQTLLNGLAQTLGVSAGNAVDLDLEHAINTAVDQVVSTHIEDQTGLLDAVSDYIEERLAADKSGDIRKSLKTIAEEIYKESVQKHDDSIVYDKVRLAAFKKRVDWTKAPAIQQMTAAYNQVRNIDLDRVMAAPTDFKSFFCNVESSLAGDLDYKTIFRQLTERAQQRLVDPGKLRYSDPSSEQIFRTAVGQMVSLVPACKKAYLYWLYVTAHLNDLMLLSYIRKQINQNLQDDNAQLLANTANTLARALEPGDADFILEKAGIRYKHLMLDEFQDTSMLQWANFLPLIQEILAGGGTTLIVGDIKQSIYRWRNGDWHIMASLTPEHPTLGYYYDEHAEPLIKSFRSRANVVEFNLQTMQSLTAQGTKDASSSVLYDEGFTGDNLSSYYLTAADDKRHGVGHEGGFVQLRVYPYTQASGKKKADAQPTDAERLLTHAYANDCILTDMFNRIENLMSQGAKAKDMLVLIRTNSEAKMVADKMRQLLEGEGFPCLRTTKLISGKSFLLDASTSVNVAISALRYVVRHDSVAEKYLRVACPACPFSQLDALDKRMPLYNLMEEVIRLCLCPSGRFDGTDVAYLNCLKDRVRDYVSRYGSIADTFLSYWDDSLHSEAVGVADTGDIRLLTIHSAKGLEAKNVFIPFCSWDMEDSRGKLWCEVDNLSGDPDKPAIVPISNTQTIAEAGFSKEYEEEHADERVDNLNLLYVALTRAADNLFVYADLRYLKEVPDNVGAMMAHSRGLWEQMKSRFDAFSAEEGVCYVEYTSGQQPLVETPKEKQPGEKPEKDLRPFEFRNAQPEEAAYYSDNTHIEFRQSQQSMLYYASPEPDQHQQQQIDFGNLCHDIMQHIAVREDEEVVLSAFCEQGVIADDEMLSRVREAINKLWDNPVVCDWFSGSWRLMREEAILAMDSTGHVQERRMDRVMMKGDTAVVLDYKFGDKEEPGYIQQVKEYMNLMRRMGYSHVEGYLWFAHNGRLKQVEN